MKKVFKKLFVLFLGIIACLSTTMVVYAETIPQTFKATHYNTNNTPINFKWNYYNVIKTTEGKYVYCVHYIKLAPNSDVAYTKGSLITDNGMNYILNQSYGAKNDTEHFIYKSALWVYMIDKGLMPGDVSEIERFSKALDKSDNAAAKQIKELIANAKKAGANDTSAPTIKVNTGANKFTLDSTGKYYVSNEITVTSSTGSYVVTVTDGIKYEKNGNKLTIKVPVNKISNLETNISFIVSNSKDIYKSYKYTPNNSKYQTLAATYKETKTAKATGELTLKRTVSIPVLKVDAKTNKAISGAELQITNSKGEVVKKWTSTTSASTISGLTEGTYTLTELKAPAGYKALKTSIKFSVDKSGNLLDANGKKIVQITVSNEKETGGATISKQDITNKEELPGAKLVVKDKNGKVIDEWVSTSEPHYIKELEPGTYTLTETIAPKGYVLSTETITFTVKNDGTTTKVVMYNTPKGGAVISKQDITNKEELPGATLVVKDYDGKVIEEWVSTSEPHYIKELEPGIYTLTETIAPEGYVLSTETITFTVKDDGTTTRVVMYNTPNSKEIPVENTASFKTITSSLIGAIIIIAGVYIIFKNSKKKEVM